MIQNRKFLFAALIFTLLTVTDASALEDAADLRQKGIAALKDSQTNPTAIVSAARCFAKASTLYEANGKTDLAVEMNSYLYWCKKKMSLADINAFLQDEGTTVSARLKAVENKSPVPSEAQAWLERADAFARANPSEHLLAAVRFFEVADRFKDTDAGRAAMSKSLAEMQQIVAQKATEAKPGKPVNLLALIDPARDAVDGKWGFSGQVLIGEKARGARLEIPYAVPKEYDFKIVFMRMDGGDAVGQILQGSGHQFLWAIDAYIGTITGFETVDGKDCRNNSSTFKGPLLKNGQWHTSLIRVRNDGVTALVDGREIAQIKTSYKNMTIDPGWKLRDRTLLGILHCDDKVAFKTIELIPVIEELQKGSDAALNAPKPIPAKSAPAEVDIHNPAKLDGEKTDLLISVDLRRDAVSGNWSMPLGLLSCSKPTVDAKLKLQSKANLEYDFHMVCARITDEGDINVILNFQQQRVVLFLAGVKNTLSGLHKINGKMGDVNGTRVLHTLATNTSCDVKIQVRKTFIRVLIDDKELFSYKLDGLRLTVDPGWETDRASISIWCVRCAAQFKEIDITEPASK